MKLHRLIFAGILCLCSIQETHAANPFSVDNVRLNNTANSSAISVSSKPLNTEELKKALQLLASTKAKLSELVRQVATNPEKFKKNGSLSEITARIAALQKRLNASSAKLFKIYDSLPANQKPAIPNGLRNPVNVTGPANTAVTNAPAAKSIKSAGKITARSPEFKSWMTNALKIAQEWKFPDITNMYGEKITRETFLKAIMYIESGGIHQKADGKITTSCCGALGFMQLMPKTAQGLGVDPRDPAQNMAGSAKYFKTVFNSGKVGSKTGLDKLIMAGCAYNCGPYSKDLTSHGAPLSRIPKRPKKQEDTGSSSRCVLESSFHQKKKRLPDKLT